ncbi:MAG: ABC transporter ATP-binding protein [Clostridia bacterium]|nr:ABC transporter ATP-binding protein [Clostridia bacterium]
MKQYLKLFDNVGEFKLQTILAPIFIILEVILEVYIPKFMGLLVDKGVEAGDLNNILMYGGIMVLMAVCSLLCGALSARYGAVASSGFARNLRTKLFGKVQDFSFYNVDRFSTGSLITRLTTDVTFIQNAFMMMIRVAFRAPIMLITSFTMAATINLKLSLIFVCAMPVFLIALAVFAKVAFPLFERMFKKFDAMNNRLQENLTAIRVVKAFVREDHETKIFRDASADVQKAQVKAEKIMVYAQPLMSFVTYAVMIGIMWFGGNMILKGDMSKGDLTSFIAYVSQILMSLLMVAMIMVNLVISQASAARVNEVLDEVVDIDDKDANPDLKVKDASITFENVKFSYNKKLDNVVLNDINLNINAGETIGVIGGTGSAKTTLVHLIPRLYDVTAGQVKVGGIDVREYKLKELRDNVAMVLQKNVLFSGTIRENLLWGNGNATQEEIEEAAKNACAHDFIMSFPDKYETYLGQGGVNVSGGQKQRLCIARALLKKPKIMILDDSTSAVDTATDASIRAAFRENLKETTVIIIAQRISSVMDADKIIVMKDGEINGFGNHEELLANNEIYREVYESQQKGAEE